MAERTGIAWTDHTFNPWIGCTKISPGCDRCYAEVLDRRFGGGHWGPHAERRRTGEANWHTPLRWNRAARKAGVRRRVFCASLADVFDNAVPPAWRADLWALIARCPDLDWQLLTKRPQNIPAMLPEGWGDGWPNVWLGTTVENQVEADRRIPALLDVPARLRFVSCEPLLGPTEISFGLDMYRDRWGNWSTGRGLDWVIIGGESGPGARAMDPSWALDLIQACLKNDVPPFFKQIGSNQAGWSARYPGKGDDAEAWPHAFRLQLFPRVLEVAHD